MEDEINYNELFGLEPESRETVMEEGGEKTAEPDAPDAGDAERERTPPAEGEGTSSGNQKAQNKPVGSVEDHGTTARTEIRSRGMTGSQPVESGGERRGTAAGSATMPDAANLDTVIRGLGITDPYTGKAVTTKAEYDAYRQRAYDERRETIKRRSGLTDAELDDFVNSTPAVQRAMADAAAARDMMAQQRRAEAKRRIDAEVAKISAMDPGVKTLADLTDKPYSGRLTELVRRGYDLADAYVVANQDALRRQSAEASRQAAYNAQSGKAGMTATKQTGQGGETLPVPKDVLEMYRALNPEMTNAEIREDYNKYLRGRK